VQWDKDVASRLRPETREGASFVLKLMHGSRPKNNISNSYVSIAEA